MNDMIVERPTDMIQEVKYHAVGMDERTNRQHVHTDSCEIMLCHTDGGHLLMNDQLYPLRRNGMYVINAAKLHCSVPDDASRYTRSMLMLRSSFLMSAAAALGMTNVTDNLFVANNGAYIQLDEKTALYADNVLHEIYNIAGSDEEFKNAYITSLLMLLLLRVIRSNAAVTKMKESNLSVILNYINNRLTEQINIDDIAAEAGLNKYYICRLFKSKTNMTISEYITENRLVMAKNMLINTGAQVAGIAFGAGFKSISYFCNVFKLHEGMTPLAYRERYGKKADYPRADRTTK